MLLGRYPTPITALPESARAAELPAGVSLLCKRDDLTSPIYGGNKVRKLEHLLDEARTRGVERIVTVGAVGSHHVLACTVFGVRAGFAVDAVLAPQPWTPHVEEVARAALGAGANVHPTSSFVTVPIALARRLASRGSAYFVPPGGSSVGGTLGYVEAAAELAAQIERKELPRPTSIVVALGSGARPPVSWSASSARGCCTVRSRSSSSPCRSSIHRSRGPRRCSRWRWPCADGWASRSDVRASAPCPARCGSRGPSSATGTGTRRRRAPRDRPRGARDGLVLDATYTGKAFAGALADARPPAPRRDGALLAHPLGAGAHAGPPRPGPRGGRPARPGARADARVAHRRTAVIALRVCTSRTSPS